MDVFDYVNRQGQRTAAYLDALARTSPFAQDAIGLYRDAEQDGLITALKVLYVEHEMVDTFTDVVQHVMELQADPHSHDVGTWPDTHQELEDDPGAREPCEQVKDNVLERAGEHVKDQGRAEATEQEEMRRQQDADAQDPRLADQERAHSERIEKFDADIAHRRENLESNHTENPALPELLSKFDSVAAAARTNKVNELAEERGQLQSQITAEQRSPVSPAQPQAPAR